MERGFALWANPSSPHAAGRAARAALEDARERVRVALGWEGEVIFTSGASEAAVLALGRGNAPKRWVSAVEHDAVLAAAPDAARLPVLANGAVELQWLEQSLAGTDHPMVAVQSINSETGNAQVFGELSERVHQAGGLVVCDASQSAGKYPLPPGIDMAIVAGHKFGGPVGTGALLVRDFAMLAPTGGQERGYRRGTENLPGALGMAAALEACSTPYLPSKVSEVVAALAREVRACGGLWYGDRLAGPTAYIHAVAMPDVSGAVQLMRFDLAGIAVSQGSACSSGSLRRSPVLSAMGVDGGVADRTIRISLGWTTTSAELERLTEVWLTLATRARAA